MHDIDKNEGPVDLAKEGKGIAEMTAIIVALGAMGGSEKGIERCVDMAAEMVTKRLTQLRGRLRDEVLAEIHKADEALASATKQPAA